MNGSQKLEKRAATRNRVALQCLGIHNVIVEGIEARTDDEYYVNPNHKQSSLDIARQGLFLARTLPVGAWRMTHLAVSVERFRRAYDRQNPEQPLNTDQLTTLSWQLAPIDEVEASRLTHINKSLGETAYGPISEL